LIQELSGKWVGYYEYGLGYELPYFGQRVKYQIEVTFEDDNIIGTASEEKSEYSVDPKATIKGYIEDDLISFVKTYPIKSTIQEDHTIQNSKGEQFVNHTGILDQDKMVMYGLWTIEIHTIEKDGFYEPNQCEGIWLLEKQ
jgi:hypothetical protein